MRAYCGVEATEFEVLRQLPGAGSITLKGEDARRGAARGAHPRAVGHAAERRSGFARAREARLPADLVRRARARRVAARAELRVLGPGGRPRGRAGASSSWRSRRWWAAPWAQPRPWRSRSSIPSGCRRSCRSPRPTPATRARATSTARRWEKLAEALDDGIDRFLEVAQPGDLPERWREVAREATRQRMERHADLASVAQALREVPSSVAWKGLDAAVGARGAGAGGRVAGRLGLAPPARRGRGVLPQAPELRAGRRGQGRVPARLAGRAPVER